MTHDEIVLRIAYLSYLLKGYDHAYYVLDDPIVSDGEYDKLYAELAELEQQTGYPPSASSPTQRSNGQRRCTFCCC